MLTDVIINYMICTECYAKHELWTWRRFVFEFFQVGSASLGAPLPSKQYSKLHLELFTQEGDTL